MTTTNHVRAALMALSRSDLRAIKAAAIGAVEGDPENASALTVLMWAICSQIVDLETEERALLERLDLA